VPPIDQARVADLLRAGDSASTAIAKGQTFEDLAAYLFESIDGVIVGRRNVKNVFHDEEIDLLLRNRRYDDGLREFPELLLVECKNWSKKVGSWEVRWFAEKLADRGLKFGVLVATNGVTGDFDSAPNAGSFQLMWALKNGREIHVLLRDEIERLASGEQLCELLITKRLELVASGTVYEAGPELPDPIPDHQVRRGRRSLAEAIRTERQQRIREILDRAAPRAGLEEVWRELRNQQEIVRATPQDETLWGPLRQAFASFGRTCWAVVENDDDHRWVSVEWVVESVVDEVRAVWTATPTSEEWVSLAEYYTHGLATPEPVVRHRSAFSLIGLAADAMFMIDDAEVEPSDGSQ
jgi:hypothetical protein